ncbi:MAG: hypothetical protein HY271_05545 [Deltaproteobacteria bacterium]|nr:hypothetical protein [Deltaproteobacteria bacterium]
MHNRVVMRTLRATILLTAALALAAAHPASAGTKYQTSLVPTVAGTQPGFSASGSSVKFDGHRSVKGKLKKVVDGTGTLVTTDPMNPADNYSVEIDVAVPAVPTSGTIAVSFDLKNGNGTFAAAVSGDPALAGAVVGEGIAVTAVRVKDSGGTVIGNGGVAVE